MRLTVLTDNNTYIDQYYVGEPALSFYIEDGEQRILFDTGYSDTAVKNAEAMGIDLSKLTAIVFSHGHNDHTRGLLSLWQKTDLSGVKLIAHPLIFAQKRHLGLDVGAPFTRQDCLDHGMEIIDGTNPIPLSEHLTYLGQIPRTIDFESDKPLGEREENGTWRRDDLLDDTALVYEGKTGLFIITGCSHSGICNILSYASMLKNSKKSVHGIIGGFHLMEENEQLMRTVAFLKEHTDGTLYPCHCVSLKAKFHMMNELPVAEVGTGMTLNIE